MTVIDNTPVTTDTLTMGQVDVKELVAALTAVLPHAGTDKTLPMLRAIKFEAGDGYLTLIATNRYTLGTYRLEWNGPDVDVLLELDDAKELLAYVKKVKLVPFVNLEFRDGEVEAFDLVRRQTFPLMLNVEFVRWRAVMPGTDEHEGFPAIGLNPAFLASFVKASKRNEPIILKFGASPVKPVRVEVGDNFIGLIMPVRMV